MRSFRTLLRRIPNMDTAAFAKWLAGVGLLDATQRGRAFRELALAEVVDPIDDPTPCCEAEAAPALTVTDPVSAPPGEDLLSKHHHGPGSRHRPAGGVMLRWRHGNQGLRAPRPG